MPSNTHLSSMEQVVALATFPTHIMRSKLTKLCRARFGNHYLPDSDDGRGY